MVVAKYSASDVTKTGYNFYDVCIFMSLLQSFLRRQITVNKSTAKNTINIFGQFLSVHSMDKVACLNV